MNELWLPVVGYEGLYEVSDLGRVWSHARGKHLKPRDKDGYQKVTLCDSGLKKQLYIHRLVLAAFVGPCPAGLQTRHGARGKTCNELSNLCYGTKKENEADKRRDGTSPQGERSGSAVLNEQAVREIRSSSLIPRELASFYGVSKSSIRKIKAGKSWAHL